MTAHDRAMASLLRRLAWVLLLKQSLVYLGAWALLWGTAVLVLRLAAGTPPLLLLAGLAAVPVLVGLAAARVRRQLPAAAAVRALFDHAGDCGGLLMASAEQDLGRWRAALPPPAGLRVRWQAGREIAVFAVAVLFLLAGLRFPERLASSGTGRPLEIGKRVEKLAAQIDALKEAAVIEPKRAEQLKARLRELKNESSVTRPAKTLEALDHLQEVVARSAKEAAESAVSKAEIQARAQALAEALARASDDLDPKVRAEAMAELARLAEPAARDLKAGKLDRKRLKELSADLHGSRQELTKRLEKLADARLIDPDVPRRCEEGGQHDSEALARRLAKADGKTPVGEMVRSVDKSGPRPGNAKAEDLARAEALAKALNKAAAKMDPALKAEAAAELAHMLAKADAGGAGKRLAKMAADLKAGKVNPEQLRDVARELAKVLKWMHDAGLLDPELLKRFDSEAVARMLMEKGGTVPVGEMVRRSEGRPGSGTDREGPGSAGLTWGQRSSAEGVRFKTVALPPAEARARKAGRLAGFGKEQPPQEKAGGPAPAVPAVPTTSDGGAANTAVILPRHREAVQRYFERPPSK
jgi:hypothetical protein